MWWTLLALADPTDRRDAHGAGTPAQQAAAAEAVIHEWGTFTSVHLPDGTPVDWRAATPTHPLPGFVRTTLRQGDLLSEERVACDLRGSEPIGKGSCVARIRMETPVIYVHVPAEARLRVAVHFPEGHHTEWYPAARSASAHTLDWGWVTARPVGGDLPHDGSDSPYYAAREVSAATLRVDDEQERFLFYRGVGGFDPSVRPVRQGREVRWDGQGADAVVVYRRDGDQEGARLLTRAGSVDVDDLGGSDPRVLLRGQLAAEGLFPDEIEAMLATWEAEWFEDGLRVFYLLDADEVDRRLPLTVEPTPREVVRVMVGRAELLDPDRLDEAQRATLEELRAAHGRFAEAYHTAATVR